MKVVWNNPPATRTLDFCAIGSLIFLATWYLLGGYHTLFVPLNELLRLAPAALLEVTTYFGDALFMLMVLLLCQRKPEILWLGLLAALFSALGSNALKSIFDAARPGTALPLDSFRLVGPLYFTRSFPSGHAITAFVLAGTLGFFSSPNIRRALLAAAFVVAFSRVGVGAHWPLDVLAGAAVGCGCVRFAALLAPRLSWGLKPATQRVLVILLTLTALWTLSSALVYPAAIWLVRPVAAAALTLTAWNYLWKPYFGATRLRRA